MCNSTSHIRVKLDEDLFLLVYVYYLLELSFWGEVKYYSTFYLYRPVIQKNAYASYHDIKQNPYYYGH